MIARPDINVFQPSLAREEANAVARVFESNWIGRGALTARFEADFADHLGVNPKLLRSVNSCTEGLFQSIALFGFGPGDEVILPSISFVGAANAIAAAGATPILCDVDLRTLNATAESIAIRMTDRTRAVLILHYGGLPCEMDAICSLVAGKGIALIEDSACSVASTYRGQACGTFGDIGVWSFDSVKILSTGDGGMIYCKDSAMAERVERLLYLGLTHETGFSNTAPQRWWEFEVSCPGRRATMNDITSAIGLEQLKKLDGFIERRKQIHALYDAALGDLGWLQTPPAPPHRANSSHYMYWVQASPQTRDRLAARLRQEGIYTTFRYFPLHRLHQYRSTENLPHSDRAADETLCIPIHQSMSNDDVQRVIDAIRAFGQ